MSLYLALLKVASSQMLRELDNETFMKWISGYLVSDIEPLHVSIALYEAESHAFPIKVSTGKYRFPSHLVALDPAGPLIQNFFHEKQLPDSTSRSHRLIIFEDLEMDRIPLSRLILEEMKRYRTEVCAKIETHDQLAGCLLIGPREDRRPYTYREIELFETLANEIAIRIEKEEYHHLSHFDPLTGLLNRYSLPSTLQTLIEKAEEEESEFGVALIDLDDFKKINDQLGHGAGDKVLRVTAEVIRGGLRKSDLAFRYGGEEFLLLLMMSSRDPDHPPAGGQAFREEIYQVLERLREKIAVRSFSCFGHQIPVTVSIGLSFYDRRAFQTKEDLIEEADQALYDSKRKGKNRTSVSVNKQDGS